MPPAGEAGLTVRFRGVRGSIPVAGPEYLATGGNTSCVEIRCGPHVLLFDAGSGLRQAGSALTQAGARSFHIFLSHSHYDHVIGLPFFAHLFDANASCVIWSGHSPGKSTRQIISELLRPPFFPAGPDMFQAKVRYQDFRAGDVIRPAEGITIDTAQLDHPGGVIGYRLTFGGAAVAYLTDTGTCSNAANEESLRLADGVDILIYDCMYSEEEVLRRADFGHSSWRQGVDLCIRAKAQRLAMFHHAPDRDDAGVDALEMAARAVFAGAFAAREGMEVCLFSQAPGIEIY
jgi:phosphoribosyl 1,2-cyclic phosphodiesterase